MSLDRPLRACLLVMAGAGLAALGASLASVEWLLVVALAFAAYLILAALRPAWHIGRGLATVAAFAVAQGFIVEFLATGSFLLPAAHFFILWQFIFLCQERSARNYGLIAVLSLIHLMVAGVLSVDLFFGLCFLVYVPAAVALMVLLNLRSELDRQGLPESELAIRPRRRLFGSIVSVAAAELALTIAVFLYFPRFGLQLFQLRPVQRGPALSGFSDRIQFGDLGRILENAQAVMAVRLLENDAVTDGGGVPLRWRATAHDLYRDASWSTSHYIRDATHQPLHPERGWNPFLMPGPGTIITQEITLEPVNTRVLFYLPHLVTLRTATPNLDGVYWHASSRTAGIPGRSAVSLRYFATSRVPMWSAQQLRQTRPDWKPRSAELKSCLQLPESVTPRVHALAESIVAGIPPDAFYDRARAVEAHLKGFYDYSLDTWPTRQGVDPVEDFLFEHRRGHCEHFASAMAILLRCLDIPARVATGFTGGEWNDFGQFYLIRQRHAHAWVEAYIPAVRDWVTFDPTPLGVALPPPPSGWLAALDRRFTHIRLLWNSYVVNYSSQEQRELRLAAIRLLSRISEAVPAWASRLLALEGGWGQRGLGGAAALALGLGLVVGTALLARRLLRWRRSRAPTAGGPGRAALGFYRRMEAILRRRGFRRHPSATPHEFAQAIIERGGPGYAPAVIVTRAFCRVRYGAHRLSRAERAEVAEALARLAAAPAARPRTTRCPESGTAGAGRPGASS